MSEEFDHLMMHGVLPRASEPAAAQAPTSKPERESSTPAPAAGLGAQSGEMASLLASLILVLPWAQTPPDWMDEARQIAAQCWCDTETSSTPMDAVLCEAVARRIAAWMRDAAQYARNAKYWRDQTEDLRRQLASFRDPQDEVTPIKTPPDKAEIERWRHLLRNYAVAVKASTVIAWLDALELRAETTEQQLGVAEREREDWHDMVLESTEAALAAERAAKEKLQERFDAQTDLARSLNQGEAYWTDLYEKERAAREAAGSRIKFLVSELEKAERDRDAALAAMHPPRQWTSEMAHAGHEVHKHPDIQCAECGAIWIAMWDQWRKRNDI